MLRTAPGAMDKAIPTFPLAVLEEGTRFLLSTKQFLLLGERYGLRRRVGHMQGASGRCSRSQGLILLESTPKVKMQCQELCWEEQRLDWQETVRQPQTWLAMEGTEGERDRIRQG